jgi:transposase
MAKSFQGLSDEQFQVIVSLMNWEAPLQRGTPRTDLRRIWNSILYILVHGVRWDDLPKSRLFAHRATAHRWLKYWQKIGVFDRVLSGLLKKAAQEGKIDLSAILVDGSFSP